MGRAAAVPAFAGPLLRRFGGAERGVAAIEFAVILPILLTLLLAGTQIVLYINASRKVGQLARSISQMISQAKPPANASVATVTAADLHFSTDAALVIFPFLMGDAKRRNVSWWQDISINYASIAFTKTTATCNDPTDQSACYTASVVWTTVGTAQPYGIAYRPCTTPQLPADNTAPPSPTTLPRSVFGPASLIVIDVVFKYTPTFGSSFVPEIKISRSAYVQPRYATLVNYDTTNSDGIASKCPGY
ncbi:TadE/TadG family type IV pilus assembly protein [Methylobacterium sp. J-076]|uniref:TadE/TadG family type IV pilus assembly protein n=1 Tax=Methylobacterium sp. J-076 TaxID=2836655 RepID=UPI001FBB9296|nr:TadE/TadG family type IV pilus assembly protein [Methylobacterium sp. J-076]MCJ2011398.1 pilus assembly protein [Methylobacterium sp. J-076]